MDVINDLGNDIALAFLANNSMRQRLERADMIDLIVRVRSALEPFAGPAKAEKMPDTLAESQTGH